MDLYLQQFRTILLSLLVCSEWDDKDDGDTELLIDQAQSKTANIFYLLYCTHMYLHKYLQ